MRRVAIHVTVNRGQLTQQFSAIGALAAFQELHRVGHLARRAGLMPDLHRVLAAIAFISRAHAFGVVHRERHGLFLVDVFAGRERIREVLAMQVLRGGDQHGVNRLVIE